MRRCCIERASQALRWLAACAALALGSPPLAAAPLTADEALAASEAVIGRPIGDYTLTVSDGRRVRLSDFRGKPLVVNFVYTGCSQVCPTTIRFLAQAVREAQASLGSDAFATLTIGFNPPADSPQAMGAFAKAHDLRLPRWQFLSPAVADVAALTRDFGFTYTPAGGGFDHLTSVTLVDASGRVFRQVYGESFELPMLIEPLRQLVTGAPVAERTLPALLERVRVLCTVYDPRSGRYRLNYALFIELFAGLTILGSVAWYLTSEWRRQRRPA